MKTFDPTEIEPPTGQFILDQPDIEGVMGNDGVYYHYAKVCTLLDRYKKKTIEEVVKEPVAILKYYAVRATDGRFFRAKGFNGTGQTWVEDIAQAKIYTKPGPAKSRITYFLNNWPEYGQAEVVELHVTAITTFKPPISKKNKKKIIAKLQDKTLNKPNDFFGNFKE